MLVVHPHSVSGGGGGSGTFSLINHSNLTQPESSASTNKLHTNYHQVNYTLSDKERINYPLVTNYSKNLSAGGAGQRCSSQSQTDLPFFHLTLPQTNSDPNLTQPDPTLTHPDPTLTHPDPLTHPGPSPMTGGEEGSIRRISGSGNCAAPGASWSNPVTPTSRSGSDMMITRYDRKSFLTPRQERAPKIPGAVDFRGMYHNRRVGLVSPPASSTTVKLQLDKFPIWGQLRRSHTDLRNSLPSKREIQVAKEQIVFFADRRGYTRQEGSTSYMSAPSSKSQYGGQSKGQAGGQTQGHGEGHSEQLAPSPSSSWSFATYQSNNLQHQPQPSILNSHHLPPTLNSTHLPPASHQPDFNDRHQIPTLSEGLPSHHVPTTGTKTRTASRSAKSVKAPGSAKSTRSSPAGLQGQCKLPTAPSVSLSERLADIKANLVPNVTFSPDGSIKSGLYPSTFKQAPGAINNHRRRDIFVKYGGEDWKPTKKPIIYENLFFPHVTCLPASMGIRFRTEMDLIKTGRLTPGLPRD